MSLQVFGCPNCQQPFQVAPEHAGQVVQCPSCTKPVEIPADSFRANSTSVAPEPQVFQCPKCTGQFGVTPEMNGQHVACPHCQSTVQISQPPLESQDPKPGQSSDEKEVASEELFAPGFAPKKTNQPKDEAKRKKPKKEKWKTRQSEKARKQAERLNRESSTSASANKPNLPAPTKPARKTKSPPKKTEPSKLEKESIPLQRRTAVPPKPAPKSAPQPPAGESKPTSVEPENTPPVSSHQTENATKQTTTPPASVAAKGDANSTSNTADPSPAQMPNSETADPESVQPEPVQPKISIAHLLPPSFDVLDPEQLHFRTGQEKFKVLIPDGKGGTAQLDNRVLRVNHDGQQVSLVSMTPEERKRKRFVQNLIMILIGVIAMAITFYLLIQ